MLTDPIARGLKFNCETAIEKWRVETMFTKEAGTIKWLQATCQPGDIMYDIGANIGIYTLLAADLVGPTGRVYAFEPHTGNAYKLLQNVALNEFQDRVVVITSALHDTEDFLSFNYASEKVGSSGHQLGHVVNEHGVPFVPVLTELKHATTIDRLLDAGHIEQAELVKIDVDGNETKVLAGMEVFLRLGRVHSVQVEIHPKNDVLICAMMDEAKFKLEGYHYSSIAQKGIDRGVSEDKVFRNAVFERKTR